MENTKLILFILNRAVCLFSIKVNDDGKKVILFERAKLIKQELTDELNIALINENIKELLNLYISQYGALKTNNIELTFGLYCFETISYYVNPDEFNTPFNQSLYFNDKLLISDEFKSDKSILVDYNAQEISNKLIKIIAYYINADVFQAIKKCISEFNLKISQITIFDSWFTIPDESIEEPKPRSYLLRINFNSCLLYSYIDNVLSDKLEFTNDRFPNNVQMLLQSIMTNTKIPVENTFQYLSLSTGKTDIIKYYTSNQTNLFQYLSVSSGILNDYINSFLKNLFLQEPIQSVLKNNEYLSIKTDMNGLRTNLTNFFLNYEHLANVYIQPAINIFDSFLLDVLDECKRDLFNNKANKNLKLIPNVFDLNNQGNH